VALTPEQKQIVRTMFTQIMFDEVVVAEQFYNRLFIIAPETRALFKGDMASQGMKLMQVLLVVGVLVPGLGGEIGMLRGDVPPFARVAGEVYFEAWKRLTRSGHLGGVAGAVLAGSDARAHERAAHVAHDGGDDGVADGPEDEGEQGEAAHRR